MNRSMRWAAGVAAVTAAGATYAVAAGPADVDDSGRARDAQSRRAGQEAPQRSAEREAQSRRAGQEAPQRSAEREAQLGSAGSVLPRSLFRETPYQGLVARLPRIGTLTWRCDDERRFFTTLTLETPGAGVTAGLASDGETVFRGRLVNPLPPPRHGAAGPFEARKTQTWTIRYHHEPATLRVVARLRFAAPRPNVECLVARSVVGTRRTPH